MNVIELTQGDSYPVPLALTQDGQPLTPDMIADLEITVDWVIRRRMSDGGVYYNAEEKLYYFIPSENETLIMMPGEYKVGVRVKYLNKWIKVTDVGMIRITKGQFKEVSQCNRN